MASHLVHRATSSTAHQATKAYAPEGSHDAPKFFYFGCKLERFELTGHLWVYTLVTQAWVRLMTGHKLFLACTASASEGLCEQMRDLIASNTGSPANDAPPLMEHSSRVPASPTTETSSGGPARRYCSLLPADNASHHSLSPAYRHEEVRSHDKSDIPERCLKLPLILINFCLRWEGYSVC